MNADIIAEITKLVMERLGEEELPETSLSRSEIKRWNDITTSMRSSSGQRIETHSEVTPLTSQDLRNWNSISEKFPKRNAGSQPINRNSDNVRFYTQS